MQSRTSFFNGTLFHKNLTRFAPVWGLYTLCLVVGLFMEYANTELSQFWFAYHLGRTIEVMTYVNIGYGLLVAHLLFGDLYTSRMCNMLHAFPIRREGWFLTNLASAMVMSLVPTAIMTIFSWVLLANTIFQNAWVISLGVFLASNLQFILFFGMAAFSTMCTANRFAMSAGYGLLNCGAGIVYFLVDTIYTPMLYGVVTPNSLVNKLTPVSSLLSGPYFTTTTLEEVTDDARKLLPGAVGTFRIDSTWLTLFIWTGVGIGFLALALMLYRKRHLECAGDAVAFPILKPVFNVLCTLFVMTAAVFVPINILYVENGKLLFLVLGLIVGWFIGKMLLERSTRVFRLKNWYGLAALACVLAVTMGLTKLDVLNIETYQPDPGKVEKVWLSHSGHGGEFTDKEDIEKILRLQKLALEEPNEETGTFIQTPDQGYLVLHEAYDQGYDLENGEFDYAHVGRISITYTLKNGKMVSRRYNIWTESEAGNIVRELTSRWDVVNYMTYNIRGEKGNALELTMANFRSFNTYEFAEGGEDTATDITIAQGLIEAIKRDCAEGTMCQDSSYHTGFFRFEDEYAQEGYRDRSSFWLSFYGDKYSWDVTIFPDSRHTIQYLTDLGLLNCEIHHEKLNIF